MGGIINLLEDGEFNLLTLGGPEECKQNDQLTKRCKFAQYPGCGNFVIEFMHLVNQCDLIVTCDTLALHIVTAFPKKNIALFGPASMYEIYLCNYGIKIKVKSDCICYYKENCKESISCTEKIKPVLVFNSLEQLIKN